MSSNIFQLLGIPDPTAGGGVSLPGTGSINLPTITFPSDPTQTSPTQPTSTGTGTPASSQSSLWQSLLPVLATLAGAGLNYQAQAARNNLLQQQISSNNAVAQADQNRRDYYASILMPSILQGLRQQNNPQMAAAVQGQQNQAMHFPQPLNFSGTGVTTPPPATTPTTSQSTSGGGAGGVDTGGGGNAGSDPFYAANMGLSLDASSGPGSYGYPVFPNQLNRPPI
jgi:hypothetical protein